MESITKRSVVKFVELAIAVVCIGLHRKSATLDFDVNGLGALAFGGYIIIIVAILATQFLGKPIEKRVDMFLSVLGCILFIAAGSMVIKHYDTKLYLNTDYGLAKGSLGIIGGVVFLVDAFLAFREE